MKFKIFTFSFMLLFAACSYGTVVHTAEEPHKRMSAIYELFEREEDENEDD